MLQLMLAFLCRHPAVRSPFLAALIFRASLKRVENLKNKGSGRYVALLLARPGLTEDAASIFENTREFLVLSAPQGFLKAIAAGILKETIDEQNYVNLSPEEEQSKSVYREFLQRMFTWVFRITRIDVIVSGNFAYYAERELHTATEALGVPFVVVHKENLKSPSKVAFFTDLYRYRRGPFTGRRIAVYNGRERDIQIAAGVVTEDRVNICGMPRLDRVHAWRRANAGNKLPERPTVVFFSFGTRTGLPAFRRKNNLPGLFVAEDGAFTEPMTPEMERLTWVETLRLTMRAAADFATANPKARVVLKSKRGRAQTAAFRNAVSDGMPPNIEWVDGGDPFQLLKESWAVVSMNSTAVLESIAMGTTVLTPGYGEAATPEMQPWLADFGGAVERMDDPQRLVARLSEICAGEPPVVPAELNAAATATLDQWTGNSDGKASERVYAVIEREVLASQSAAS